MAATEAPDDEDEDDWDDDDEADDDGKIYKNPRNSPSSDCPRDEEQATLLVNFFCWKNFFFFFEVKKIFF